VRSWISKAVAKAKRNDVTFSIRPVTPKTFWDSFAMHPVPQKAIHGMMGHKGAKSTEWYTRVFALKRDAPAGGALLDGLRRRTNSVPAATMIAGDDYQAAL